MKYSDLVQLYFERSNALQSLWTLYVVVIGGILAFSSIRKQPDLVTTLLVSVLFCLFAQRNIGAIHDITLQRFAVVELIKQQAQGSEILDSTLLPPDYTGVRNFHVISDVLTVAAVWAMEIGRRRRAFAVGALPTPAA